MDTSGPHPGCLEWGLYLIDSLQKRTRPWALRIARVVLSKETFGDMEDIQSFITKINNNM